MADILGGVAIIQGSVASILGSLANIPRGSVARSQWCVTAAA